MCELGHLGPVVLVYCVGQQVRSKTYPRAEIWPVPPTFILCKPPTRFPTNICEAPLVAQRHASETQDRTTEAVFAWKSQIPKSLSVAVRAVVRALVIRLPQMMRGFWPM